MQVLGGNGWWKLYGTLHLWHANLMDYNQLSNISYVLNKPVILALGLKH